MQLTARELAELLNGEIVGDSNITVSQPGKIESGKNGDICFLGNILYEPYAYSTQASILLVDQNFSPKQSVTPTLIRVKDVYASVATLLEKFGEKKQILLSETIKNRQTLIVESRPEGIFPL